MMECYLHKSIPYTSVSAVVSLQRNFVMGEIRKVAKSHIVRTPQTKPPRRIGSGGEDEEGGSQGSQTRNATPKGATAMAEHAQRNMMIEGVQEAGWRVTDLGGKGGMVKPVKVREGGGGVRGGWW